MTDQWHDDGVSSSHIRDDGDEAPDDWENEEEEKPKVPVKPSSTTDNKKTKNKPTNDDKAHAIIKQPDGDYTPEQLDEIESKREIEKEQDKLEMVEDLLDPNGQHQSLDNIYLVTKDEFINYSLRLSSHLNILSASEFYPEFIDHFLNGLTKSMPIDGIKRLSAASQAAVLRKQSEERDRKAKTKAKKPIKPKLTTIRRADFGALNAGNNDFDGDGDYDEEDFI